VVSISGTVSIGHLLECTSTTIIAESFAEQRYCPKASICKLCCICLQVAPKMSSVGREGLICLTPSSNSALSASAAR
jgi:hypothetical protein